MAAEAIVHDRDMVEIGRYPGRGRMTVVAGVAARNVRRILAGRDRAVVAREARPDDLCMIDGYGRRPYARVVAGVASIGGVDVVRRLARRLDAVVTTGAGGRDVRMIERRRYPCR